MVRCWFCFVILLRLYGSCLCSGVVYYGCVTAETGIWDVWACVGVVLNWLICLLMILWL